MNIAKYAIPALMAMHADWCAMTARPAPDYSLEQAGVYISKVLAAWDYETLHGLAKKITPPDATPAERTQILAVLVLVARGSGQRPGEWQAELAVCASYLARASPADV